jgi:hypothetical protein
MLGTEEIRNAFVIKPAMECEENVIIETVDSVGAGLQQSV